MWTFAIALLGVLGVSCESEHYSGLPLGALSELQHGVKGQLFAVDARTLYLRDFYYDGEGPAAYFYVGRSGSGPTTSNRLRMRDERGSSGPLRKYSGEGVALTLPEQLSLTDVRWFAVYCDDYEVNFGSLAIPRALGSVYPRPARLGALRGVHAVASDTVLAVDAQTLLIPNFSYDGEAPDAKFWVGRGPTPSPQGIRIPDENGKETPLQKYDKKTIVLTLPGELTVFDIGHLAVWCEAFTVNFGHVTIPRDKVANVPPSLKMLGVSPQSKLNCEVLLEDVAFEVRWALAGDSIVLQLVAKLEEGEYMSFGISGSANSSRMVGGDVAVAWLARDGTGRAVDYYLDSKSQCSGGAGSCPDTNIAEKTNSLRLLNTAFVNGYSIITYQRALKASDALDRDILKNQSQPIIWAIGPLNGKNEVSYHTHYLKTDKSLLFSRPPQWNCPLPDADEDVSTIAPVLHQHTTKPPLIKPNPVPTPKPVAPTTPWEIPPIQCHEPADGVFYAQMGPTGGKQGYSAITGHVGWGISWYMNGLLIPEIYLVRGRRYTFVVEGGSDPAQPAKYHPFYITDDPVGGYAHKTDDEKKRAKIFAGARTTRSGEVIPTGVGRLCSWTPDSTGPGPDRYPSFGAYQRALSLVCEDGSPGVVQWTPDQSTPDTVYYQCFTHRHLGWKINIVDECDESELRGEESIQVQTRVKPDTNHILDQRKKYEKIINTKQNYDDFSSEPAKEYDAPITNDQIQQVIEAAENLENKMKQDYNQHDTANKNQDIMKDLFLPEQPIRDDEEFFVEPAKDTKNHMFPGQRPLTLQSVMRPNGQNRHQNGPRPPFRRPSPPEIKRRPPQMSYPLSMPGSKDSFPPMNMMKYNRFPMNPNMNRPPMSRPPMGPMPPPMRGMPSHGPSPNHQQRPKPIQPIIMGNPMTLPPKSQTLSLGKTDLIANQVVKSQITLPNFNEPITAHRSPQTFLNKPGQIILGKPMENPVPLDQQMIPTQQYPIRLPERPPSPEQVSTAEPIRIENEYSDIKSSDFMGESPETSSIIPAVNTGFKPDSIVIESGFKPIIREPLMAAGYEDETLNRREDTDIEEDYEEAPQVITHHIPSDKQTESFEPMFIPSPEDHMSPSDEPKVTLLIPTNDRTKEIFPSNHAKEDRPHPVYIKSEKDFNSLFSKPNTEKEVPLNLGMESHRISPQYSPHIEPKVPSKFSSKVSSSDHISVPKFKPFQEEVSSSIEDILKNDEPSPNVENKDQEKTSNLKLPNSFKEEPDKSDDELTSEQNETKDITIDDKNKSKTNEYDEEYEEDYEESISNEVNNTSSRKKRETKTTLFDPSDHNSETLSLNKDWLVKNQVDFDIKLENNRTNNAQTLSPFSSTVLLFLFLNLF